MAELIRAVKMHEHLISLCRTYEPVFNGSSALQRFKSGNVIEIRNGAMFDFYPGVPHMCCVITLYLHHVLYLFCILTAACATEIFKLAARYIVV